MNKVTRIFIFVSLGLGICSVSCRKMGSHPSWDTQVLAPLIKTSLSINNIVTNSSVKSNLDSSVTLIYSDSLYNLSMDSLLKIPDTTLLYDYASPVAYTFKPGDNIIPTNVSNTIYNVGSAQLKEAIIQSGFVKVEATSYVKQVTDYTYLIPSATLNSKPLDTYMKVPAASGGVPGRAQKLIPLNGYVVDFTGPTHNLYNNITTSLSGILDSLASSTTINPGDSIVIKATFYNLIPYYGTGYFSTSTHTFGPQQSTFPLFSKITSGNLNLQDVNVNFVLENGFGVDARVYVSQLVSINSHTGNTIGLSDASIINNAININRATRSFNPASPVYPSIQTYSITPANSNILQWIDNLPTKVGYTLQVTTDPLGNVSGSTDFVFNGYGIKAYLDVTVPLSVIASNLTLADTVPVNFSSGSQAKQIKSGVFTLYATNGFPFSAGIQVYMLNNNLQVTDSLLNTVQTISPGITDAMGKVISPQNSTLTIPVNASKMQELQNCGKIIIMARFNTGCATCTPPQYSKIYNYYLLNVKLVGNFDYQVKG